MKKMIKKMTISVTMFLLLSLAEQANAQPGPPQHGSSGDQPIGGSAPIGSGVVISLVLGLAYGVRKVYFLWSKERYEK